MLHALKARRRLSFDYHSSARKARVVEPLVIEVFRGTPYLVARVAGTDEVKGYRLSRMTSTPVVLPEAFAVDDETLAAARAWRPEFTKAPVPVDVVVETTPTYRDLSWPTYPGAAAADRRDGRAEVGLSFDSQWAAMRFLLDAADRVTLKSPQRAARRAGRVARDGQPRPRARPVDDRLPRPGRRRRPRPDPPAAARGLQLRGRAAHQRAGRALRRWTRRWCA